MTSPRRFHVSVSSGFPSRSRISSVDRSRPDHPGGPLLLEHESEGGPVEWVNLGPSRVHPGHMMLGQRKSRVHPKKTPHHHLLQIWVRAEGSTPNAAPSRSTISRIS